MSFEYIQYSLQYNLKPKELIDWLFKNMSEDKKEKFAKRYPKIGEILFRFVAQALYRQDVENKKNINGLDVLDICERIQPKSTFAAGFRNMYETICDPDKPLSDFYWLDPSMIEEVGVGSDELAAAGIKSAQSLYPDVAHYHLPAHWDELLAPLDDRKKATLNAKLDALSRADSFETHQLDALDAINQCNFQHSLWKDENASVMILWLARVYSMTKGAQGIPADVCSAALIFHNTLAQKNAEEVRVLSLRNADQSPNQEALTYIRQTLIYTQTSGKSTEKNLYMTDAQVGSWLDYMAHRHPLLSSFLLVDETEPCKLRAGIAALKSVKLNLFGKVSDAGQSKVMVVPQAFWEEFYATVNGPENCARTVSNLGLISESMMRDYTTLNQGPFYVPAFTCCPNLDLVDGFKADFKCASGSFHDGFHNVLRNAMPPDHRAFYLVIQQAMVNLFETTWHTKPHLARMAYEFMSKGAELEFGVYGARPDNGKAPKIDFWIIIQGHYTRRHHYMISDEYATELNFDETLKECDFWQAFFEQIIVVDSDAAKPWFNVLRCHNSTAYAAIKLDNMRAGLERACSQQQPENDEQEEIGSFITRCAH